MKVIGIVVEYNPFHNGHVYQINKVKKMYVDSLIICVMSSHFMQRGDVSLIDKWNKTSIALNYGCDIIIELPTPFSIQSSDVFAKGAIKLLSELKIDTLVFGSESDDINKLTKVAKVQLNSNEFDKKVKTYIDKGNNYPSSLSMAIKDITHIKIDTPNDLLAVSYIKEILKLNKNIDIVTIKRTNDFNDLKSNGKVVSANNIREKLKSKKSIKKHVPLLTYKALKNINYDENTLFNLIKYKVILEKDNLDKYNLVTEGISSRIVKSVYTSNDLDSLIKNIKTKRFTYNRIKRILINILLDFTKEDNIKLTNINYIRILGMSEKGKKYINNIKKDITLPIISRFIKNNENLLFELKVTNIYSIIMNNNKLVKEEYNRYPIIK